MNSFMSWVGGKKNLRDEVLARFPPYYERYIEVFGGAGWVLFHKPPGMDFEVYNDFNSNLANLYRCVRDKPAKLKYKLRYVLDSREDFEYLALLHKRGILPRLYDVDRAAKFYQLIRYSYASGLDSFGSQPHSMWSDFPMIDLAARRLQKVVVENKDFERLIRQYDRPVSFFYCDPPYFATENYYKDVGFTAKDWFCQYHLTHFIRTRIMQRERYDHSRAFFELPEAAHRWRCRFFCWPSNSYNISRS